MSVGFITVVASVGHGGHCSQVTEGHEREGQSGQFCSGHSVECVSVYENDQVSLCIYTR